MRTFNRLRPFSPRVFILAGLLMLVQVSIIGLRRSGLDLVPEWWAAPPAIGSVVAIILGLITLYPRTAAHASRLSHAGVYTGISAGLILIVSALYLLITVLEAGAIPQPLPRLIEGAIALFVTTFVVSLVLSAAACLKTRAMRVIGVLLLVPVVSWCLILAVAITATMTEAIKLDVYTNGVIAIALLAVGILTREAHDPEAQPGATDNPDGAQ